ncbi:hypothetical protein [Flagellimonas algicola]|uniref:Uncharacterized protein n=1 Tax=Flagellimonas algicola TaxID=2583815 RepID=A0ABY2WQ65_9FLAO|nr:hypothetical protein [Allomuricauda algicola]TMU57119.1 hypothetical protein FGG15_06105 [Allomuricauda algicola]
MIYEIKKSINSILYERVSSPLFGTFIVSWLIWNWRIVYLTFFVDSDKIELNKVDFILKNYNQVEFLVWYPLISTVILITIIPFISNGAYWLNLRFSQWKIDQKKIIEKKQLLSIEQSIKLREQFSDMEKRFDNLLSEKNDEIKQLELTIDDLRESNERFKNAPKATKTNQKELRELALRINQNSELKIALERINQYIQGGYTGIAKDEQLSSKLLSYFESNEIISNSGKGMYELTEIGKKVNKYILDEDFSTE